MRASPIALSRAAAELFLVDDRCCSLPGAAHALALDRRDDNRSSEHCALLPRRYWRRRAEATGDRRTQRSSSIESAAVVALAAVVGDDASSPSALTRPKQFLPCGSSCARS